MVRTSVRVALALLVSALTLTASAAAFLPASVTSSDSPSAEGAGSMPLPRMGDHVTYSIHYGTGHEWTLSFLWAATEDVVDRWGRTVPGDRIDISYGEGEDAYTYSQWYHPGTLDPVRTELGHASSEANDLLLFPSTTTYEESVIGFLARECLVAWPARSIARSESLAMPTDCTLSFVQLPEGLQFRADGKGEGGTRFSGSFAHWYGDAHVNVTLSADVPYPKEIGLKFSMEDGTYDVAFRLAGFVQGQAVRVGGPVPRPPGVPMSPRTPWGLDEAGAPLEFPAAEAYEAASGPLAPQRLADFLAAHPDAYSTQTSYHEFHDDGLVYLQWQFILTDGVTGMVVLVERNTVPVLPAPASSLHVDRVTAFEAEAPPENGWVHPQVAAGNLPRASHLFAAWDAIVPPDTRPNGWAQWTVCADAECVEAVTQVTVAREVTGQSRLPGAGARSFVESAGLYFDDDGGAMHYRGDFESEQAPVIGKAESSPPAPERHSIVPMAVMANGAFLTPVTAGAGLLALLVGVLTYLLTGTTGFGVFGFSRVVPERATEHPTRRMIADAVRAQPGLGLNELAAIVGGPRSTVRHHAALLVQAGVLVEHSARRRRLFFPAGPRANAAAAAVTKADGARALLETVRANPGSSATDIARKTGLVASTVTYHAQRLSEAGLLDVRREGRTVRLTAVPSGSASAS